MNEPTVYYLFQILQSLSNSSYTYLSNIFMNFNGNNLLDFQDRVKCKYDA